jgi:hypothetical protein
MNILKIILTTTIFLCVITTISAQTSATFDEVNSKQKKGFVDKYITQNGEEFKVGDTITLGVAFRNDLFDFIQQNAGIAYYPLTNAASHSKVVIKNIKISMKTIQVNTTKPQGHVYGLMIYNLESAIKNGEIVSKIMTSDQALTELKKWKDKLDLGIINEEEFNKKKEELMKYIK